MGKKNITLVQYCISRLQVENDEQKKKHSENFAVYDSPVEVQDKLLETFREEGSVTLTLGGSHLVDPHNGPRVNWRVHIVKGKLVGGYLSIGGHIPLPKKQHELALSKLRVNFSEGDHVEGKVPGSILCVWREGGWREGGRVEGGREGGGREGGWREGGREGGGREWREGGREWREGGRREGGVREGESE